MDVTYDVTATLRSQEHGHQPVGLVGGGVRHASERQRRNPVERDRIHGRNNLQRFGTADAISGRI